MRRAEVHREHRAEPRPGGYAEQVGRDQGVPERGLQDRAARGERTADKRRRYDPRETPVKHDIPVKRIRKAERERRTAQEERHQRSHGKDNERDKYPHDAFRGLSSRPPRRPRMRLCSCRSR